MSTGILGSTRINLENFTDRIEPRKEFWTLYHQMEEQLAERKSTKKKDLPRSQVMMYHGVGGIGKTTLLAKLKQELIEDRKSNNQPAPVYADYSFQSTARDYRSVLRQLCTELQDRGGFAFPHLLYGLYHYAVKRGEPAESPNVKGLLEKNPVLAYTMKALDFVPVVGSIPKLVELADAEIAKFLTWLDSRKDDIKELASMDADSLYAELPILFAKDMQMNIQQKYNSGKYTAPVVIFLDTYEDLVNDQQTAAEGDSWLRCEWGIVRNIPGVLWVFAGRNALRWEDYDPYWTPGPAHYLLGSLSDEDSYTYLQKQNIHDKKLLHQLYKLTNGTPLFLDICVQQYRTLSLTHDKITIDMFGKSPKKLIESFILKMSDSQTDIVYMLSALQNWTESLLDELAPKILRNYSDTAYYSILEQSFIQYTEDTHYHIHKTMSAVLQNTPPGKAIGKRTGKELMAYFAPTLKKGKLFSPEFAQAMAYATRGAILYYPNREDFRKYFEETLLSKLLEIVEIGYFHQILSTMDMFETYARQKEDDLLYVLWLQVASVYARTQNNKEDALGFSDAALLLCQRLVKEGDPVLLSAMHYRAVALNFAEEYQAALELEQQVLETCRASMGKNALATLRAKQLLAIIKNNLGDSEEALRLQNETREQLVAHHPDNMGMIFQLQSDIADTYGKMGFHKEELVIRQNVWEQQCNTWGEDDPRTLLSMDNMADSAAISGNHSAAIAIKEMVVEKFISSRGATDQETINAMQDLESFRNEAILHSEHSDVKQADESYTDGAVSGNIVPENKPDIREDDNTGAASDAAPVDAHTTMDKIIGSLGISADKLDAILSGDIAKFRDAAEENASSQGLSQEATPVQNTQPDTDMKPSAPEESPEEEQASNTAEKAAAPTEPVAAEKPEESIDPSFFRSKPATPAEPEASAPAEAPAAPATAAPSSAPKILSSGTIASLAALIASKAEKKPEEKKEEAATADAPAVTETPAAVTPAEVAPETPAPTRKQDTPKADPADTLSALAALMAAKAKPEEKKEEAAPVTETAPAEAPAVTETPAAVTPAEVAPEAPAPTQKQDTPKADPADTLSALAALMAAKAKPEEKKEETAPVTEAAPAEAPAVTETPAAVTPAEVAPETPAP
ncbi:MAG: hypothetical protein J6Q54_07120, partial [Oscillospiraceae bacterium]|nr:hypothetical protein [Oscillospiraceae bacterium]